MLTLCTSLERQQAKMRSGKTEFLVTEAEASLMEESPNPKIHVVTRWFLGRWLDMVRGGEENTKQIDKPDTCSQGRKGAF